MTTLKFRVVPDIEEDIFRDIEIGGDRTFEDLYKGIMDAFGFRGDQLASFYLSNDEWDKGHEIALMDMGGPELEEIPSVMSKAIVGDIILVAEQKLILVYDFLKMWCFYIEAVEISDGDGNMPPKVTLAFGDAPIEDDKEMPDLMEGIDDDNSKNPYDDDMDDYEDEFDSDSFENIDDLDI